MEPGPAPEQAAPVLPMPAKTGSGGLPRDVDSAGTGVAMALLSLIATAGARLATGRWISMGRHARG
ncbi:MAG: hypothetical protein WC273_07075 [Dehalococcoidia bacterium]